MKSNPHVYPYTPFRYLGKAQPTSTFLPRRTVGLTAVKRVLSVNPIPRVMLHGRMPAEKIMSIFLNPAVRFGPREYITGHSTEWLEKIERFTSRGKPIQFTILGFPFKTPVPLKTNRQLPDLGELLALQRLAHLMRLVHRAYAPGGVVTVFTEGPFAPFAGVSRTEAAAYRRQLAHLCRRFGFSAKVKLVDLGTLERFVPRFRHELSVRVAMFRRQHQARDKAFMEKFTATLPSVYRIMNTRGLPLDFLRAVYADAPHRLSSRATSLQRGLRRRTTEAIFQYFAYLKVRDDFNLIERARPDALALTVSPKPHRLGIIPLRRGIEVLYTHGVPVVHHQRVAIEYLFDLERSGGSYTPIYFNEDPEGKPFYYLRDH